MSYFFSFFDGRSKPDTVRSEHPDLLSARNEAVEAMGEHLKGAMLKNTDVTAWQMTVTDENGFTVIILSLTAAAQIVDQSDLASARRAAARL